MRTSQDTDKISAALAKAQAAGNREAEADALFALHRATHGKFKSNRPRHRLHEFIEKLAFGLSPCWYWIGSRDGLGYGHGNGYRAHREAYRLFNGNIPYGMSVLHRCDVRCCVNPEHLFLGTQADNIADMIAKGRRRGNPPRGEASHFAKLTAQAVSRMRNIRASTGRSYSRITKEFGVSTMTAYRAIVGESWRAE